MATELIKIQSYICGRVANQLIAYKKAHHLRSTSEAIAAILADFFGMNSSASDELAPPFLGDRLKQLEDRMLGLVGRIEALERDRQVAIFLSADSADRNDSLHLLPPLAQSHSVAPTATLVARSTDWTHLASTHSLNALQQSALSIEAGTAEFIHDESLDESLDELLDPAQTEVSAEICVEEMLKGIPASLLVRRLETTPKTLRKHLRDAPRLAWAVERDPNGWGWIYEPLLQRYYPVNVDADGNTHTVERDEITTLDGDDMGAATAVGS